MRPTKQYNGLYMGKIVNTRAKDVWVRVKIPQLFENEPSNWARPMGFDSWSVSAADLPWEVNDGAHTHADPQGGDVGVPIPENEQAGFHTSEQVLYQDGTWHTNLLPSYTGERLPIPSGPGPKVGTVVLVMFMGGDRNRPVYALTTQNQG